MSDETYADDLEKEIIFMEQELILNRVLLEESRQKLELEIAEHSQTKVIANKYMNENAELQIQLEVCLTGTQKLEEENQKNREVLVKNQVQLSACMTENQQLLDACYETEKENATMKAELLELKKQIQGHLVFLENIKQRKSKTEALITDIIAKQEILNKEQSRLETVCKEGLRFAEKLSEEAKFQFRFVKEAKIGQVKMEKEMVRLMAALRELKTEREKNDYKKLEPESSNYLQLWKIQQKEMKARYKELEEINQRLVEELNFTKEQIEILLKSY